MKATHRHAIAAALLALVGGGSLAGLLLTEPPAEQVSSAGPVATARAGGERPIVALGAARASDPIEAGAASDVPTALGLRAGDVREGTFRFESRLCLGPEGPAGGSGAEAVTALATVVEGRLTVTCYEASADGVLLGERWAATSLALEGQDGVSRDALLRALSTEVLVRLDRRGAVRGLALPASASPEARNLQRALVASGRLVLPAQAAARWTAAGFDPIGPCEDAHVAAGAAVTRTRRFLGVAGAPAGSLDLATDGEVELVLADDGLPARLAGREVVRMTSRDAGIGMTLTTVTALERTAERTLGQGDLGRALASVEAALGPSAWSVGLAPELDREGASAHATRPEPRELEALVTLLALAMPDAGDAGVDAEAPRLFLELAERFRRDPAAIARAIDLARGRSLTSGARATLIDSLGEAGTAAAQRALIALARDPLVQDDVVPNVFLSLAEPTAPLPDVVATLEAGSKSDDPLRREWATQGLGVLAGRASDPSLADRLAAGLERSLGQGASAEGDRVLLEALGNAGRARSVAAIVAYTKSPDEELRATAVGALRQLEGQQVDAALARGLADSSDLVRREALRALAARGPAAALAPVATALQGDPEELVRLQALDVLAGWLADGLHPAEGPEASPPAVTADALRAVVQRAAANDASPEVREVAASLLAGA